MKGNKSLLASHHLCQLWDIESSTCLVEGIGRNSNFLLFDFIEEDNNVIGIGNDAVFIWGPKKEPVEIPTPVPISSFKIDKLKKRFISGNIHGKMTIYDIPTHTPLCSLNSPKADHSNESFIVQVTNRINQIELLDSFVLASCETGIMVWSIFLNDRITPLKFLETKGPVKRMLVSNSTVYITVCPKEGSPEIVVWKPNIKRLTAAYQQHQKLLDLLR